MATAQSLDKMLGSLFSAPGKAAVDAEKAYRKIWIDWLDQLKPLAPPPPAAGEPDKWSEFWQSRLQLAPVMKINGHLEIGITMRIASVEETSVNGGFKLGIGPIGFNAGGSYMTRSSEESVMQIRANFTMSNQEQSLSDLLKDNGITLAAPGDLDKAITFLNK